ncbi:MAG: MarR family transcriptional regulator, partial [Holdemanella sp.]|nr:MarR family transcriptional regulator [Holdemanella sp.]
NLCKENNIKWNFEKSAFGFTFEFIRKNNSVSTVYIEDELTTTEQAVLDQIRNKERISKADIARNIDKGEKTVQRAISKLIKLGYIIRVGSNKTGYWRIRS